MNLYHPPFVTPGQGDFDFAEYLKMSGCENQSIFHFGTGAHHHVAREDSGRNFILGLTFSAEEQGVYLRELPWPRYLVLLADVYSLDAELLPRFDLVTSFHLCEYGWEESRDKHGDDAALLRTMIATLKSGGELVLWTDSFGWDRTTRLLNGLEPTGEYKSLRFYRSKQR